MESTTPRPLMSVAEAAKYLNCSASSIRRLMKSGRIPVCRAVSDAPRLRLKDLDALIAATTRTEVLGRDDGGSPA